MRPLVVDLEMTCWACPAQWTGRTSDGLFVYIRYRFGRLSVGFGDTLRQAAWDLQLVFANGEQYDGEMSHHTMTVLMSYYLQFSDEVIEQIEQGTIKGDIDNG